MEKEKLSIITEVGVFGSLNIDDPTTKDVKKKKDNEDIDQMIRDAIDKNSNINI